MLEPDADQLKRLETMLFDNQHLYQAYLLEEDLRQTWQQDDKETARRFIRK